MGARQKLNRAYVNGALLWATGTGLLTQSAVVFFFVLVGCLYLSHCGGFIRTARRKGPPSRN